MLYFMQWYQYNFYKLSPVAFMLNPNFSEKHENRPTIPVY